MSVITTDKTFVVCVKIYLLDNCGMKIHEQIESNEKIAVRPVELQRALGALCLM